MATKWDIYCDAAIHYNAPAFSVRSDHLICNVCGWLAPASMPNRVFVDHAASHDPSNAGPRQEEPQ